MIEAALSYAERGWPVFPCKPRTKVPATIDGLKAATTDADTVRGWWRRWPDANVAIRTGTESGLVVLDVDVQHGGAGTLAELERERGKLPETPRVLTGGGGQHVYFRHPGEEVRNSAGALGPGLDVRGDGGYVVAPPSVHENGRLYKWLVAPERPSELLTWLVADARERRNGAAPKVAEVIPEGQRRAAMLTVAGKLKRSGLTGPEILPTLLELNRRWRPPLDERELESVALKSTISPDPGSAIPTVPATEPRALDEVVETFKRNLYLPDAGIVYVALATVAANRLEGDPSWTIIVGPSSGGKTEVLNAVSGLEDVHHAGTLTEASLLSGTPSREKAKGARGGLLRVIGERGLLVCKDFGSVLSMHRDARAATLAALREIYDGSWDRHVGTDGGRSLHWDGKLGLLAGATPAIDQHHGALAVLGDRFVFYRLRLEDASEQARRSLDNTRRIVELRTELRDAVSGLFGGLDLGGGFPAFDARETERLVALATLVVSCRSAVIRDTYQSREVELVPDAEAPGRLIGALGRLLAALRLIGVDDERAWAIVVKTGLDSMPVLRRRVLELLLAGEGAQETGDVAATLDLPTTTTKRVLEDLTAHGVLNRNPAPKGKAHTWEVVAWTRQQYRVSTEPEMSEHLVNGLL